MRKAIGFYWTLPVRWRGFTCITEEDVDKAAEESRTIRMQRDLIRRWVNENGFELIREKAFMEVDPGRGSELIREQLEPLLRRAEQQHAKILYVQFRGTMRWRSHVHLAGFVSEHSDWCFGITPDAVAAKQFELHFETWQQRQHVWTASKPHRAAAASSRARELIGQGLSLAEAAKELNAENLPSLTGKPWTGDNLRKLLNGA